MRRLASEYEVDRGCRDRRGVASVCPRRRWRSRRRWPTTRRRRWTSAISFAPFAVGMPSRLARLTTPRRCSSSHPVIGSNPSTGFTFGAAGQVARYRGPVDTTSISTAVASLTVSTRKQVLFNLRSGLFTSGNQWFVEGDNRLQKTSQDTYGLGGAPDPAGVGANYKLRPPARHRLPPDRARCVCRRRADVRLAHQRRTRRGRRRRMDAVALCDLHHHARVPAEGQQSGGFSLNALVDTRDTQINANRAGI